MLKYLLLLFETLLTIFSDTGYSPGYYQVQLAKMEGILMNSVSPLKRQLTISLMLPTLGRKTPFVVVLQCQRLIDYRSNGLFVPRSQLMYLPSISTYILVCVCC